MHDEVLIVGSGGHARACLDAWPPESPRRPGGYVAPDAGDVLGLPRLGDDDDLGRLHDDGWRLAFVALGAGGLRRRVSEALLDVGFELVAVRAPTATVGATAAVGAGTITMHRSVVGARAEIGRGGIVNTGATVDHDCVVGDYVHIAPGVNIAGGVTIGDGVMIGIGASVVPGVAIGEGATVGAGAVVIRDVPPGRTVVGVPAQELRS